MSRTSTDEADATPPADRLELTLEDLDLDMPLRRALGRGRPGAAGWLSPVTLVATRRPFGW